MWLQTIGLSKTKLLIEETILQAKESEIVFFPETAIILDEERNKAWHQLVI